jgi:hypothetical protein
MDLLERRLHILDDIYKIELTVDDLRRIMKAFCFVAYKMELDGERYLDRYDKDLMDRLDKKYRVLLFENGIDCF